jgi:hypothetical protein
MKPELKNLLAEFLQSLQLPLPEKDGESFPEQIRDLGTLVRRLTKLHGPGGPYTEELRDILVRFCDRMDDRLAHVEQLAKMIQEKTGIPLDIPTSTS